MLKKVMTGFSSFFYLAEPKNFAGKPFCVVCQKTSGSEKNEQEGGSINIFR